MNLTALQHSAFLQSLGWAIANSLWQAAALWLLYYLVTGGYKNASAKFKNNFSTSLLLSAFIWFCVTLCNKYALLQIETNNLPQPSFYDTGILLSPAGFWQRLLNNMSASLPYLSSAYLLLLLFLAIKLINSYRFIYFIKTNGLQKAGVELKMFTQRVAMQMGITKKINLWISEHIDVPATIGFLKPVILIPLASINQLSAEQLEAIILHELSHIKRNDYLLNILISLIETILFFNPFIVLLAKIIKRERENCSDDFVIQYQYDRHSYASALLSLEQFRSMDLRFAVCSTSGKKQLLHRIKRIMEATGNSSNFNYGQKLFALALITGIICSVAWLSPQKSKTKVQNINISSKESAAIVKKEKDAIYTFKIKEEKSGSKKFITNKNSERITIPSNDNSKSGEKSFSFSVKQTNQKPDQEAPDNSFITENFNPEEPSFSSPAPFFGTEALIPSTPINKAFSNKENFKRTPKNSKDENLSQRFYFSYDAKKLEQQINEQLRDLENCKVAGKYQNAFNEKISRLLKLYSQNFELEKRQHMRVSLNAFSKVLVNMQPPLGSPDSLTTQDAVVIKRSIKRMHLDMDAPNISVMKWKFPVPRPAAIKYRIRPKENDRNSKEELPKEKSDINIQYSNGVIVVNGKKINLLENGNNKLFQALKAKRLIYTEDKNVDLSWND